MIPTLLGLEPEKWSGKLFSNGWTSGQSGTLPVKEPATGISLGEVASASATDVRDGAAQAKSAQAKWAEYPLAERAPIFRRAARFLEANADQVKEWIVRETGSVPAKAAVELKLTIAEIYEAAAMVTQPRGLVLPSEHKVTSLARRLPHGVVGVISPFNFPMILSMRAVAPALAVGNAVVLKPDPRTPVVGGMIIARAFEEAGLPDGLLHVLPGGAEAGEALVTDPDVAMISFTGSTAVGRRIGALAGERLKKVSLELGGKNSLIILDDADLDLAVSNTAWGAFLHQGQICMATGRVLVPASLAARFIEKLTETANRLPVGDPFREQVALGPLIDQGQVDRALGIVNDSVGAGARLRAGGTADGAFFRPTVLDEVGPGMPAFEREIFAPVAPITVYRTDEEAIELANMTYYGLSAGIISGLSARALEFAAQLKVGLCHVNDQTVADEAHAPFGGTGASGNGSSHGGPANWDAFTRWQWLTVKHAAPSYPF
ncbi:MAG TPA: benzaldehyde dehydrogenase [Allosphingosinicella sp.]|jgi:benzaldehyde dehydrogenase (NAD)|uniref:benzaldehyde dehydrogenase n=1 Tax=Allosphingosinicella sp. TaxID=2823234 RepID=UPI002F274E3D